VSRWELWLGFTVSLFNGSGTVDGLEAPPVTWIATLALTVGTVGLRIVFSWKVRRETGLYAEVADQLRARGKNQPLRSFVPSTLRGTLACARLGSPAYRRREAQAPVTRFGYATTVLCG